MVQNIRKPLFITLAVFVIGAASVAATSAVAATSSTQATALPPDILLSPQTLDGSGNNKTHPDWGKVNTQYLRVAPARYSDGRSGMVAGPNSRAVSNRIHSDVTQNVFSERAVTQWGWLWGQFIDHNIGLKQDQAAGAPANNIPFNAGDPLESFSNTTGSIPFTRSAAAPGTGVSNARQQINTVSSYLDADAVYGGSESRLEFLREGSVDGVVDNNGARLLLPGGNLPRRDVRGNAGAAPVMELNGRVAGSPGRAFTAGDVRANENIALSATHTLFAREHNRIVSRLPFTLSEPEKFAIARRVVIAEIQFITYNEFLPAMGVGLPGYTGYKSGVNASIGNEFATVAYRAHSQIHGEFELEVDADRYTAAQLAAFEAQGLEVVVDGDEAEIAVPLSAMFFNPDLMVSLGAGPVLHAAGLEAQYKNDEQIDNNLRSVLFKIPSSSNPECLDGPTMPQCFNGVQDLGALDIERGRDHGMPSYNQMRVAFGLPAVTSFTQITGEATEAFPTDPELTRGNEINDPDSLDFVRLTNNAGQVLPADSPDITIGTRRTTVAARLKAIYGNVNNIDAFVGLVAEKHASGSELGPLQRAVWAKQFAALRDGDRFFFGNDTTLTFIRNTFNIDYRQRLSTILKNNTDVAAGEFAPNVFITPAAQGFTPAGAVAGTTTTTVGFSTLGLGFVAAAGYSLQSTMPRRTLLPRRRRRQQ